MTGHLSRNTTPQHKLDWPLIVFFILAYVIAWGSFAILTIVAHQSGLEKAQSLLAGGEAYLFDGLSLIVPELAMYLLTRLADFAFSIAGIMMIAFTGGRTGCY